LGENILDSGCACRKQYLRRSGFDFTQPALSRINMRTHLAHRSGLLKIWNVVFSIGMIGFVLSNPGWAQQTSQRTEKESDKRSPPTDSLAYSVNVVSKVKLKGTVRDQNGDLVPNVAVRIMSPDQKEIMESKTDQTGRFELLADVDKRKALDLLVRAELDDGSLIGYAVPKVESSLLVEGIGNVEVWLGPPREVEIKIVDDNQFSVEDAIVVLAMSQTVVLGPFRSDENGIVRTVIPMTGAFWQVIAAKKELGMSYGTLPSVVPRWGVFTRTLTLENAMPLRVQLRGLDNKPVIGARVICTDFRKDQDGNRSAFSKIEDEVSVETDDTGEAWLDVLPFGIVNLVFVHPDYEVYRLPINHNRGAEFVHQVSLRNVVTNRCRVLDQFGNPYANHEVQIRMTSSQIYKPMTTNRTDENGMIEFSVVAEKPFMITASVDGMAAEAVTGLGLIDQRDGEIQELRLKPFSIISGCVRDETTKVPLPGKIVYLSQLGKGLNEMSGVKGAEKIAVWQRPRIVSEVTTDSEGRFRFQVPAGEFNLALDYTSNHSLRFMSGVAVSQTIDLEVKAEQ
jgi:5-hydroxyisourate hydrolase-like protein (transthyretin family)